MGITELIVQIVKVLSNQDLGADLKLCVPLAGYLNTTDLSAVHSKTPAVFIANVGTSSAEPVPSSATHIFSDPNKDQINPTTPAQIKIQSDLTLNMVAYLLVVDTDSQQRATKLQTLLTHLYQAILDQRWALPNCFPAKNIQAMDFHGLPKDVKPDMSNWRAGVAVCGYASDLLGQNTDNNIALWAITWEQVIRVGEEDEALPCLSQDMLFTSNFTDPKDTPKVLS